MFCSNAPRARVCDADRGVRGTSTWLSGTRNSRVANVVDGAGTVIARANGKCWTWAYVTPAGGGADQQLSVDWQPSGEISVGYVVQD